MKRIILIALAFTLPFGVIAQGKLFKKLDNFNKEAEAKKDKLGHFEESQYIIEGEGHVVFTDGVEKPGTIKFVVGVHTDTMKYFRFTPAEEMKPKKIRSGDVVSFTVNGSTFYPIRIKKDDLNIGNSRIFVEMLHDAEADKFKMYRYRQVAVKPKEFSQTTPYELKTGYFVMLSDFKNAHEITDITFTPFAKKMSGYLKDCPTLADKIKSKEEGYKYNAFDLLGNDEVFLRIMKEYNECGQE